MKKYSKQDKRLLAIWAAKCAERVLPFFEKEFPKDKRPRNAIKILHNWIKTGKFSMKVIRKASLDSHAAARKANGKARFAARAAGQAVATAHVPQHAFGPSYYALKIAALNGTLEQELKWQTNHLNKHLRKDFKTFQKERFPKELRKY